MMAGLAGYADASKLELTAMNGLCGNCRWKIALMGGGPGWWAHEVNSSSNCPDVSKEVELLKRVIAEGCPQDDAEDCLYCDGWPSEKVIEHKEGCLWVELLEWQVSVEELVKEEEPSKTDGVLDAAPIAHSDMDCAACGKSMFEGEMVVRMAVHEPRQQIVPVRYLHKGCV